MENKPIKCRFCQSQNTIKKGFRKTQNRGKIQKYFCRECHKFFVEDNGFLKMKNNPQKVTCALDLFYRGVSTRKVQEHFQTFLPHNSSHMSIYRWIIKYSNKISSFTNKLKLKVGNEIQIDEMEIGSRKSQYRGYFIDSIDTQTRFMVASEFAKDRDIKQIKEVLWSAKYKTENQVKIVTSDSWRAYPKAIHKTFTLINKSNTKKYGVIHNQICASKGDGFNHKIERLHNNVRHRIKTFRGFHGSVKSANAILKGWEIYYNFITKHQAIGKCPYELATDLKLASKNKWLNLIGLSC